MRLLPTDQTKAFDNVSAKIGHTHTAKNQPLMSNMYQNVRMNNLPRVAAFQPGKSELVMTTSTPRENSDRFCGVDNVVQCNEITRFATVKLPHLSAIKTHCDLGAQCGEVWPGLCFGEILGA